MKKTKERIFLAPTFYWGVSLPGILLLYASIKLWQTNFPGVFTILLFYISINLILALKFIQIDYKNQKIRSELSVYPFGFGKWESLSGYDKLVLTFKHHVNKFRFVAPNAIGMDRDVNYHLYQVYLIDTKNKKSILLSNSSNIPEAQKELKILKEKLNIEVEDRIQQTWDKYRNNRR
ncbi:hypothetical protein ACE1ET_11210 [Saccharicrinis sp. FJH62]|uniref:hypothetical protein n=1 Tax=Saccharicrinis sp. FJH62 TaxID=3344657 RepID=UPI0035D4DF67